MRARLARMHAAANVFSACHPVNLCARRPCIIQIPSLERRCRSPPPPQRSQLIAHLYKCTLFSRARKSLLRSADRTANCSSLCVYTHTHAHTLTVIKHVVLAGDWGQWPEGGAQARCNIADRSLHAYAEYVYTYTHFDNIGLTVRARSHRNSARSQSNRRRWRQRRPRTTSAPAHTHTHPH